MSRYNYVLLDDWQIAVSSGRTKSCYGFLMPPKDSTLSKTNQLRQKNGLRTIEIRNTLVEVENNAGMNFYLPNWINMRLPTLYIEHLVDCTYLKGIKVNKHCSSLIDNRFEMPNVSYTCPLYARQQDI